MSALDPIDTTSLEVRFGRLAAALSYAGQMNVWRYLANALWTTEETVAKMKAAASA